jgi:hypothetical protein
MNITIRLSKVELEMLKELQKKDKRYKKELGEKVKIDIKNNTLRLINQILAIISSYNAKTFMNIMVQ